MLKHTTKAQIRSTGVQKLWFLSSNVYLVNTNTFQPIVWPVAHAEYKHDKDRKHIYNVWRD